MILAAYRDSGYKIVLLIHIVTMIVAMAPAVAHPILFELEKRRSDGDVVALAQRVVPAGRIYVIALFITGAVGFGLVSMSEDVIAWGDTWVWLSILVWIAMNGVLHGALLPAERALAGGDQTAVKKLDTFGPIIGIMVLVLAYLMVVKPGGAGL